MRGGSTSSDPCFPSKIRSTPSNYRSTAHIIRAANIVISPAAERMKTGHDVTVDRARRDAPPGGPREKLDPVGQGRVQILPAGEDRFSQAALVLRELQRLAGVTPRWDWAKAAVIARDWQFLTPVRSCCEALGIPVQTANQDVPNFWRLRKTRIFLGWLESRQASTVTAGEIAAWLDERDDRNWWRPLTDACAEFAEEIGAGEALTKDLIEWLAEWGRDLRRKQTGLLLLTAHRAKGLLTDGLPASEAACAEALNEGVHSADVILNILARRRDPGPR